MECIHLLPNIYNQPCFVVQMVRSMVARGRVKGGVIVLDEGVLLPEGQVVDVVVPSTGSAAGPMEGRPPHSVLDIPTVHIGAVLRPLTSDDDLLEEMLEGRL